MKTNGPPERFKVNELVRAVRLDGNSLGGIVEIDKGSIVELRGDAVIPGLVEITHDGRRLALFYEDLTYRSQRVSEGAVREVGPSDSLPHPPFYRVRGSSS